MAKVTDLKDAIKAKAVKGEQSVKDEPPKLIYCMFCKHWQATMNPAFGHCLLGAKSLSGPFVTTDLATCTRAEARLQ